MKNAIRTVLMGALAAVVMATGADACARKTVSGGNALIDPKRINQSVLDQAIQLEMNYQRCRKGLAQLKIEPRLRKVAESHARWMARAQKLSHKNGSSSVKSRIKRAGVGAKRGSENIMKLALYQTEGPRGYKVINAQRCKFTTIAGQPISRHTYNSLAQYAVKLWLNSPAHRKNMVDRKAKMTATAAGYDPRARNCGALYLSQKFAG